MMFVLNQIYILNATLSESLLLSRRPAYVAKCTNMMLDQFYFFPILFKIFNSVYTKENENKQQLRSLDKMDKGSKEGWHTV